MVQSYVLHRFQSTPPRGGRRIRITRLRMRFNPRPHAGGDSCILAKKWGDKGFNPRPRTGATGANNARAYTNVFQSTSPREGRPHLSWTFRWASMFQSTPPREGRLRLTLALVRYKDVSIHAPTRGATRLALYIQCWCSGFNPRHHTRGDDVLVVHHLQLHVSIHAPARGATSHNKLFDKLKEVSIHAPTRGATWLVRQRPWSQLCFNPRPHARGDIWWQVICAWSCVSIHAPTRGATISCKKKR